MNPNKSGINILIISKYGRLILQNFDAVGLETGRDLAYKCYATTIPRNLLWGTTLTRSNLNCSSSRKMGQLNKN